MTHAVMHRLVDGRWRVTNAPDDWVDDGRDYPAATATDAVFEHEADAVREYLARTSPVDPEDVIAGPDAAEDDGEPDALQDWGDGGGRGR